MKILALDSTAIAASVALCEDDRLLGEYTLQNGNTHSETLLPMIESLLGHFSMEIADLDLFALSAGPGSFTGVRIGAATIKGLAHGRDIPCIGISTLEALAENLSIVNGLVCPLMNARRGQVYTALFRASNGHMERLMPDSAMSITDLNTHLTTYGEPVYLCGDGAELAAAEMTCELRNTPARLLPQSAYSVAQVARAAYLSGLRGTAADLKPIYLRLPQAERERLEREKANAGT